MIGQLRGALIDKRPNQVLLDVGGVGYLVHIPLSTFYDLGELREETTLLIYTHVREDALVLYGFLTSREKHFFEMLISASGVGPSLALKILSGMNVEELVPAIRQGDLARLVRIPGVGKKTAEKMCFELSEKMGGLSGLDGLSGVPSGDPWEESLRSALTNLGFKEDSVLPVVAELRASKPPLAEAIRQALKALQR